MSFQSLLVTTIAAILFSTPSNAAWFARLDSNKELVVTGVAEDDEGISSTVTLTCRAGRFGLEILSRHNADEDDLPQYKGTKVALSYKIKGGDVRKMGVEATPKVFVGGVLGFVSTLSTEQSQAIYQSISRGNRLDVELLHPELIHDVGSKKVFPSGFVQAMLGINQHCLRFD